MIEEKAPSLEISLTVNSIYSYRCCKILLNIYMLRHSRSPHNLKQCKPFLIEWKLMFKQRHQKITYQVYCFNIICWLFISQQCTLHTVQSILILPQFFAFCLSLVDPATDLSVRKENVSTFTKNILCMKPFWQMVF